MALKIEKHEELKHIVVLIMRDVQASKILIPKYAKLVFVLGYLTTFASGSSTTLKAEICETCCNSLMASIESNFTDSQREGIYSMIEFFSELYNLKIVEKSSFETVLKTLFSRETNCFYRVHCIDIIMRTIGPKNDKTDKEMLDKYFKFFQFAVEQNAISYRTKVYKALIDYKNSGWSVSNEVSSQLFFNDTKLVPLTPIRSQAMPQLVIRKSSSTENFDNNIQNPLQVLKLLEVLHSHVEDSTSPQEGPPIILSKNPENSTVINLSDPCLAAQKLKNLLSTPTKVEIFVSSLIEQISINKSKVSVYALLFKELIDISDNFGVTFKETLNENVFKKFATFVSKQNLDEIATNSFGNVVTMVAELYKNEIFCDDDLSIWLQNKHVKKISIAHLTEISSIISMRILTNSDKVMGKLLKNLEDIIYSETLKDFSFISNDIRELQNLFETQNFQRENLSF